MYFAWTILFALFVDRYLNCGNIIDKCNTKPKNLLQYSKFILNVLINLCTFRARKFLAPDYGFSLCGSADRWALEALKSKTLSITKLDLLAEINEYLSNLYIV